MSDDRKFKVVGVSGKSQKGVHHHQHSKDAVDYVKNIDSKVILIDGVSLAHYMIKYNVGVSVTQILEIKRIDTDYFHEE